MGQESSSGVEYLVTLFNISNLLRVTTQIGIRRRKRRNVFSTFFSVKMTSG